MAHGGRVHQVTYPSNQVPQKLIVNFYGCSKETQAFLMGLVKMCQRDHGLRGWGPERAAPPLMQGPSRTEFTVHSSDLLICTQFSLWLVPPHPIACLLLCKVTL